MAMLVSLTSFAAEVTGTLTFDDKSKRTVYTTSQQVWVENGITMTNDKSASTSNVADYAKPVRLYASSKITVSCDGVIKNIVFDCNSTSYATSLKNSITSGGTVTVSSDKVTVVPTAEANEFVVAKLSAQVRLDALTVTYVAEEEDPNATIYTITATSADETMGTVAGAGEYAEGKTVTLTANANPGYEFVKWSNESTENPLIFKATENVTLAASFVAQTPITIAEANKLGDSKTAILNEFTVTYIYKSYIHIQDASGYGMIFQSNFGLKVGDVVSGFTCSKSTYNGLPQFVPTCKLADLTVEAGEAPAVVELTTAPTGNYHQVIKLMNLQMTGSFNTSSGTTINATCPDGTTIAIYNGKNHTYTFVADKTYNITGDVCQYSGKIQVSAYAIEEYVAPEPVMFTVTATAENGTVEGAGEYAENAEATLTATAAEGYEFVNWTVDGAEVSTENPYTFVVTANVALVANFKAVVVEEPLPEGVPTNAELWEAFKPYYNTYYGLTRADQPIDKVSTFAAAKMQEIMTDAKSEYKWLGDYVLGVAAGQGVTLPTDMAAANEGAWRWAVHAFFNATTGANGAAGTDFTEAGKPQVWGPYYLAAQQKPEPVMETVYFVNAASWTGTVNAYAWVDGGASNANWPGAAATKEAEQIAGYDVYSYTAEQGQFAKVIFNNGSTQTADLAWTAGKYFVLDGWYTKEEAEAKLATPIVDEVVYFVNNKKWSKVNAYAWEPANAAWPGKAATKEAEQIGGFDVYSYSAAPGTYQKVIFNDGGSNQTADMVWTAGKYIVNNNWYTKEEAEAALAAPVVTTWTMVGDAALFGTAWDLNNAANDLVKQEDGSWVLTLKEKTLSAKSYEYKAAKDRAWTTTVPGGNNAKLTISKAGKYNITFTLNSATTSVTAKSELIPNVYTVTATAENGTVTGAGEYTEGTEATLVATANEGYEFVNWTEGENVVSTEATYTFTVTKNVTLIANFQEKAPEYALEEVVEIANLTTETLTVGEATYLQLTGRNDMLDSDVMLFLNNYTGEDKEYEVNAENSLVTFGGLELTVVEGKIAQATSEEKGKVYAGRVIASVEEEGVVMLVALDLNMYSTPAIEVVIEEATAAIDAELATLTLTATWEGYPVKVTVAGYEDVEFKEYSGPQISELEIGDDANWLDWAVADLVAVIKDGQTISIEGEYTSYATGKKYALMITGTLPAVEEPEVPVVSLPGRAWAYNLALAVEGNAYTFSFQTSTDANATLVLTNEAGEELDAIDLGAVKAGKNKVTLEASDLPENQLVSWGIKMSGEAIADFVEVTDETRGIYNFYLPQGVAVDNNPESATFGTIFVAEATDGASDGGSDRADTQKRGIFVYNQYLDELNPTNEGIIPSNVTLGATSRQALRRVALNPVTNEVAFAHNAEPMAVWAVAAENVAGEAKNLIEGLGFTNVNAICFNETGALYVLVSPGYPAPGSLYKVENGVVDTLFADNARFGNADVALTSDGRGGIWIAQNRGQLDAYNQLTHVNAAGTIDFEVNATTPHGFESQSTARGTMAYNYNEDVLALGIGASGTIGASLYKVTYDEAGVPTLEFLTKTPSMGKNVDGLAFDYAGDIYGLSANKERFFKFAVPTENNVCTTPAAKKYAFEIKGQTYTDNALNPFAFNLSSKLSADASTLTVKYSLNNSKATSADVVIKNGEEIVAVVAGTTNLGKNTVKVPTAGLPGGVELTWAVVVNGTSVAAPTQEEKTYSFYHPSGLDIDNNPENATFGLIITNEAMQSVASKTEGYVSANFGAGIFAFTPSFDLIANGDKPGYNGGNEFTTTRADGTGTAYAPRRVRISEDGRIFVTSLNTDGNYLWEVNPANLDEWTPVFKGTLNDQKELTDAEGNFVAAPNVGFDVKGSGENLQLAMYSANLSAISAAAMGGFRLHEYNLGTATEWSAAPKALVEGKYAINYVGTQVEYDNEGGFWIASYRGSATDANPGLVHINAEGVEDAKLVWNNVRQAGIRFNHDFTKLVVAGNNGAAKKATIYAVSKDANGAPVLTEETVIDMAVLGNNLNDFAFDYAGNLYGVSNSNEKIVAWAMPYAGEIETPAAAKYAFQLEATEPVYEVYEDAINNLVIDYDNLLLIGGPSDAFQVEVVLGLGEYNMNEDKFQLLPESSISVLGSEATFVEGWASVDGIAQTANAVVRCMWNEMALELHLTMSAAPLEATVVVVENAVIEIEKYLLFGDMYDYALKMTGVWSNEGVDYPVLVEVPVYYPEATEPYDMYSTVTVGGWGDTDPWLGFGEGYLTITQEGQKITATGVVENPMAGIAIDITISGTINNVPDGLENLEVTVKSVKMIKNGKLVIVKDGVEYNAQGAILK